MMRTHYIGARYIPLVYEGPDGSPDWLPGVAYEGLTIVKYGNFSYISKKPVPAGAGDPETAASYWIRASLYNADVEEVRSLLDQKADKDGSYPDLWAGNILTDKYQTDRTPYILRRTGGGLPKIGEREDDTLVGATVNANQILTNLSSRTQTLGITITADNNNGSITVSGTATATNNLWFKQNFPFMANRVYLLKGSLGNGSLGVSGPYSGKDTGEGILYKFPSDFSRQIVYGFTEGVTYNETLYPQLIDLTDYFGSASIADYIYSIESATAGAGLAQLREWGFLTDEYIPYNPGSLESVEATAHVMRDADNNIIGNYDLGTDTLRGLFKLDANNNLYADGDVKTSDGTVTRYFAEREYQEGDESLADAVTDGTTTVYKLSSPVTEQSTPFASPQICDPDGTEEYVTSNGVPVGHETKYYYSIKRLAEELIDIPEVPEQNGTYTLKATRDAAGLNFTWEV